MYTSHWVGPLLGKFLKVLYIVTLYSKYTRALTFENFWGRVHLSMPCMLDIHVLIFLFFYFLFPGACVYVYALHA
jgi:hypothetical protein